ncbi:hypothetical protein LCGC14_0670780 [marine sediment metagenome]|uniref:Uncharacterized protein n=2 Tax=root TaxID=1 RepID=A0A831QLF2_9FLAO|nr:hypothetical protein [Pricia antarctica]
MKKIKIRIQLGLLALVFGLPAASPVMAKSQDSKENITLALADKFVGGWSYTVEGAPEGYKDGLLVIVKEGDGYKVQVQIGGGTLLGENVQVKGSTITFDVMVEGGKVAVALTAKGDTITGKSTSSEGSLTINGKKTISMD